MASEEASFLLVRGDQVALALQQALGLVRAGQCGDSLSSSARHSPGVLVGH